MAKDEKGLQPIAEIFSASPQLVKPSAVYPTFTEHR